MRPTTFFAIQFPQSRRACVENSRLFFMRGISSLPLNLRGDKLTLVFGPFHKKHYRKCSTGLQVMSCMAMKPSKLSHAVLIKYCVHSCLSCIVFFSMFGAMCHLELHIITSIHARGCRRQSDSGNECLCNLHRKRSSSRCSLCVGHFKLLPSES
jgi:hypothetical protein